MWRVKVSGMDCLCFLIFFLKIGDFFMWNCIYRFMLISMIDSRNGRCYLLFMMKFLFLWDMIVKMLEVSRVLVGLLSWVKLL